MSFASIIMALILGVLLYVIVIRNRLATQTSRLHHALVHLAIQIRRRHGVIEELLRNPWLNLHGDRQTLEALSAAKEAATKSLRVARYAPGNEIAMAELTSTENALDNALARLIQIAEFSKELGSSKEIKRLLDELAITGKRVTLMSQIFNSTVMYYNMSRNDFPCVLLAGALGHRQDATPLGFVDSEIIPLTAQPAF